VYSGGSSPISIQTSVNLDLEEKKLLSFEDVIYQEQTMKLVQMVAEKVYEKFQSFGGFSSVKDVLQYFYQTYEYGDLTPYWYFNHKGVVVFFNQYELGLQNSGVVKVELSYLELEGILLPEFFPQNQTITSGKLIVLEDAVGCRRIHLPLEPEGNRLLIGIDGNLLFHQACA
jgi:hypothetical protein